MDSKRFDNIIIKLQRRYGREELVKTLTRRLSESEIEIGKLKSYIDELEYNHKVALKKLRDEINLEVITEVKKTEMYEKLNAELRNKRNTISQLVTKLSQYEKNTKP